MKQKNRINEFIKQELVTKLEDSQTTVTFGTPETSIIEGYKNEYKCKNTASAACSANFRKCTNEQEMCKEFTNTFECTNK